MCQNGGTCVEMENLSSCICAPGFTNTSCEIEINECETLPCYPFGKCTDKINGYNCSCYAGFTPRNNTDKQCDSIDECLTNDVTCQHDGICHDYINAYRCHCPLNGTERYYGDLCENKATSNVSIITGVSRTSGILSGGAALTFYGTDLSTIPPLGVNFIDAAGEHEPLFGYVQPDSIRHTSFVVLTPKANEALLGANVTLVVIWSGGYPQTLPFNFQYVANPQIVDITPRVQLATGGIQLTVIGSNLNEVVTSTMGVTLQLEYPNGTYTMQNYHQTCDNINATAMNCRSPVFNLPSIFFNANSTNQNSTGSRKRRHTRSISTTLSLYQSLRKFFGSIYAMAFRDERSTVGIRLFDTSEVDFRLKKLKRQRRNPVAFLNASDKTIAKLYVGFLLDNYPKYENISRTLPNITFTLIFQGPQFRPEDNERTQDFDPDMQEPLKIKGRNLLLGCSKSDYSISVGAGICNVTTATDNLLTCSPPVEAPPVNNDTLTFCRSSGENTNYLAVMVNISIYENFAFCVQYTRRDDLNWVIGVCVGCGCGLLILLVVVAVSVRIHRQRKSKAKRSGFDPPPTPRRAYGRQQERSEIENDQPSSTDGYDRRINPDTTGIEMRSCRSGRSGGFGVAPFLAFAKRISYTRQHPEEDTDHDYNTYITENENNDYVNYGHAQAQSRRMNDFGRDMSTEDSRRLRLRSNDPFGHVVRPEVHTKNKRRLREVDDESGMQEGGPKWKFNYPNVDSRDSNPSRDYANPNEFSKELYDRRMPRDAR